MTDTRFETVFEDTDDLLGGVDVDDISDVEALLMVLFARPVVVEEVWDDEGVARALEVIIQGNDEAIGSVYAFPLSIIELTGTVALSPVGRARGCCHDLVFGLGVRWFPVSS